MYDNQGAKRLLRPLLKAAVAAALVFAFFIAFRYLDTHFMSFHRGWLYRRAQLSDPQSIAAMLRGAGVAGPIISAALTLVSSVILAFPTAFIVFANAFIWGFAKGAALTLAASLGAACICFALSRRFGRPWVERLSGSGRGSAALSLTDRFFTRYGGRAVLVARLIPIIPFDLVSLVAGLSGIRFGAFLASTAAGLLPAVVVYSWLAAQGAATHRAQSFLFVLLVFALLAVLISIAQKPLLNHLLYKKKKEVL